MATPLLEVRDVVVRFGGIVALDQISFDVTQGTVAGLIGPNGAGKTTLFNCLSRLYSPNAGDIRVDGRSILRLRPHRIAKLRLGRTFQNLALFETMTVMENAMVGGHNWSRSGFLSHAIAFPTVFAEERKLRAMAREVLEFLGLSDLADQRVGGLPFGTKKRVELARALVGQPRLILLDEPAGGLNHEEVEALGQLIRTLCDELKITVLLVEHHMNLVMRVSDQVIALDFGRKIADGTPDEVRANEEVIRAYLGTDS